MDSTAMDAAVLNLVVPMATVEKEEENLCRGVLEDVLVLIMLSVDLEEVEELMATEEVQEEEGDILVEHREIMIIIRAVEEVVPTMQERNKET